MRNISLPIITISAFPAYFFFLHDLDFSTFLSRSISSTSVTLAFGILRFGCRLWGGKLGDEQRDISGKMLADHQTTSLFRLVLNNYSIAQPPFRTAEFWTWLGTVLAIRRSAAGDTTIGWDRCSLRDSFSGGEAWKIGGMDPLRSSMWWQCWGTLAAGFLGKA